MLGDACFGSFCDLCGERLTDADDRIQFRASNKSLVHPLYYACARCSHSQQDQSEPLQCRLANLVSEAATIGSETSVDAEGHVGCHLRQNLEQDFTPHCVGKPRLRVGHPGDKEMAVGL